LAAAALAASDTCSTPADAVLRTADTVLRRAPSVLPFLEQAASGPCRPAAGPATWRRRRRCFRRSGPACRRRGPPPCSSIAAGFAQLGVTAARLQLIDLASPADLLDGATWPRRAARRTSVELDRIAQVAACLYGSFGECCRRCASAGPRC